MTYLVIAKDHLGKCYPRAISKNDVKYIEIEKGKIIYHMNDGGLFYHPNSLKDLEILFPSNEGFERVDRMFIANTDQITTIDDVNRIICLGKDKITASNKGKKKVLRRKRKSLPNQEGP